MAVPAPESPPAPISPRVRVAAVIPVDDRIVVVRHRREGAEYLLLPGGGVEWGEPLGEALLREIAEETGLECRIVRPLILSDSIAPDASRHVINMTFLSEQIGGTLRHTSADPRVIGVETLTPAELLSVDFRPPIARWLTEYARSGFADEARYLGAMWTDHGGPPPAGGR